jgi:hypothetical protein
MSGPPPEPDLSIGNTIRAIVGVALGRPAALRQFGDTPRAFITSLIPLIVVPLLSSLMTQKDPGIGRFLLESAASVAALLVPPVLTHALARAWGREEAWLRFATAFNWCQFGLLMVAMVGLFVIGGAGGRDAAVIVVGLLGLYALWLHWFLTRHGLGVSAGRSAMLVLSVHVATSLVVLVPRFIAALLRS